MRKRRHSGKLQLFFHVGQMIAYTVLGIYLISNHEGAAHLLGMLFLIVGNGLVLLLLTVKLYRMKKEQ